MNQRASMQSREKGEITTAQAFYYALPFIPTSLMFASSSIIQGIYAKYFGLALTSLGVAVLLARLFDAVSDPTVGWLSDKYRARTGTTKPFIGIGAVMFIISGYFFYVPPEGVTIQYFLFWFVLYFLGWTIFEIPHVGWPVALTLDNQKRTLLFSFRSAAYYAGIMLFYLLPLLPFFDTNAVTPETMKWSVIVAAVLLVPTLYFSLKRCQTGIHRPPSIILPGNRKRKSCGYPGSLSVTNPSCSFC